MLLLLSVVEITLAQVLLLDPLEGTHQRKSGLSCARLQKTSIFPFGFDQQTWIDGVISQGARSNTSSCVIFGSCNYCVSTVVESTWKYIVFVTIQCLLLNTCVSVPYSTSFITTCCDYLISLWIELNFWDFILVTFEQSCTCSCENIINSRQSISWGCS